MKTKMNLRKLVSLTLSLSFILQLMTTSYVFAQVVDDLDIQPINMPKVTNGSDKNNTDLFPLPEEEDLELPDFFTPGGSSSSSPGSSGYPDYGTYGVGQQIGNIDESMVSGVNCPLVDNQPRQDLLAAANALSQSIAPLKQCRTSDNKDASNSAEVDAMQSYLTNLINSGTKIKDYIKNPGQFTADKSKLRDMQTEVSTIIRGVDQISQTLMKNSMMNGECAKGMMKFTDIVLSLSDLVQSATPYAMMALEANPAFAPAIPFVIGLSAAGNVSKVIKRISDDKSLNMYDERTRTAVLQNICEYSRIVQRIRTFNSAKRGDLRDATNILNKYNSFSKKVFSKYSSRAQEAVLAANEVKSDLNVVKKSAMNDQSEITELYNEMQAEKNNKLACYISRDLVKRAGNPKELPTRAIVNIKQALTNRSFLSDSARIIHSAMLTAEESLRTKIVKDSKQDSSWSLDQCAADGKAYVDALNRLVNSTQNLAINMQDNVDQKMFNDDDPEVRSLAQEQNSIQQEEAIINILNESADKMTDRAAKKTTKSYSAKSNSKNRNENAVNTQLLETLNKDNGVRVDAEINRNLLEVKMALFGKRDGFFGTSLGAGKSPAYAWYLDTDELVRKNNTIFTSEIFSFKRQVGPYTAQMIRNVKSKNWEGKMTPLSPAGKNILYAKEQKALSVLNLKYFPQGSSEHTQVCQKMNNLLDVWQGTLDHFGSLIFYCNYLRGYMDQTFDPNIIRSCTGKIELTDTNSKAISDLTKLRQQLISNAKEAKLIQSKISELRCQ